MVFFFCKQKTAYEMRISDWSSDVCSSDLWPITPVEAASTSWRRQPRPAATASTTRLTEVSPVLPVKAFALPEFTMMARARPRGSCARHQSTGAEAVLERVSTPATVLPGSSTIRQRSGRPRTEEQTTELKQLMHYSYAVFWLKTTKTT